MYSMFKTPIPDLSDLLPSLKKMSEEMVSAGEGSTKHEMDTLPFSTYRFISMFWLRRKGPESIFSRTYTILSWNLICEAAKMKRVHLNHISWSSDAMQIYFSDKKNDQDSNQSRFPRHIYPNPFMPEICPILAIGLFWVCFPLNYTEGGGGKELFTGNFQNHRYQKSLEALKKSRELNDHFSNNGLDIASIGFLSKRKGLRALDIQGNQTEETAGDSYNRYSKADDQHSGRCISGLPQMDERFATVGPFFRNEENEILDRDILNTGRTLIPHNVRFIFPNLPDSLYQVGKFALASLVYHFNFLNESLDKDSPIRFVNFNLDLLHFSSTQLSLMNFGHLFM